MKIAVTGAQGLLGEECVRTLGTEHSMLPLPSHSELDLADFKATHAWFMANQPDVVIHTAANRDPDSCELNPDQAWANALISWNVVNAARDIDAVFVHASTDSVFSGSRDEPYHEFDEARDPINLYGRTKLAAEKIVLQYLPRHFNLRLPLLFGRTGGLKHNNLLKFHRAALSGQKTTAAGDTYSSACSVRDVARSLAVMLRTTHYGTYHFANAGTITRAGYLQAFFNAIGMEPDWVTVSTIAEMARPAKRCHHILIKSLLLEPTFGITLQPFEDAIAETAADLKADGIL